MSNKNSLVKNLSESLATGFIDGNLYSLEKYHPKLLINDHKRGMKVLTSLISELKTCEEFYFSVAFITQSGVVSLINTLNELKGKNIKGKIITGQYQNFTEPKALKILLSFKNIELKIVTDSNFHAKGYIFKKKDNYSFIIGSSNLTQYALSSNQEWNLKMSSLEQGLIMQTIMKEFNFVFENATKVDENWIEQYTEVYKRDKKAKAKVKQDISDGKDNLIVLNKINPNKMQAEALKCLEITRNDGKDKALLISATGTGKTYLSAFDVAKVKPKKFLFVVHRENIAKAALKSFKKILGESIVMGMLTGNSKHFNGDYIFATIQTLSKEDTLGKFEKTYFDYIVIDEVHRSGAKSYKKIIEYFKPKFLLGMSATPERTDGFDIFKAFDYNIAYEIRLNKALEENMLAPFHYFGIGEIQIDGRPLDEKASFNDLVGQDRVCHIIKNVEDYGWYGERVKGLIFCSRIAEARYLSEEMNRRGYKTISLNSESSEEDREKAIIQVEQEEREGGLDYILTVDIFNEGVDIPMINQIVMLRPTQSAIIFVQQLGRGLRKVLNKEYLTVIDFIGNYKNNYMVPIALYGDSSYNKDTLRKLINSGSSTIPGCSTINFDKITKEKIFESINSNSLSTLKDLNNDYKLLKYEIGHIPMMMDFVKYGKREPYAYVNYSNSYYGFLRKMEEGEIPLIGEEESKLLEFFSKEILNGKRVEEVVLLAALRAKKKTNMEEISDIVEMNFGYIPSQETLKSAVFNLNGEFLQKGPRDKYGIEPFILTTKRGWELTPECLELFDGKDLARYLEDMIQYAFQRFTSLYSKEQFREGFILYEKYSRKDVCRILNWEKNEEATMFGYSIKLNTCPIFVKYQKEEKDFSYEDHFINHFKFNWISKNNSTYKSKSIVKIMEHKESGLRLPLFIQKSNAEGSDFYYMGDMQVGVASETTNMGQNGKPVPVVNIIFDMIDPVGESIYTYFEE